MKIILSFLCLSVMLNAQIFVSPNGNNSNDGTISSPFKTIEKALERIKTDGDTIYLRAGIYSQAVSLETTISGNPEQYKFLISYPGEYATIDFSEQTYSSSSRGIKLTEDYWHIKGIEIKNAGDNGIHIRGHHNIVENCSLHHNKDTGLQISNGGSYNQIINCDSYMNYDPNSHGENADGFAPKLDIGPGNYFKNCRAYNNSDDGWDCYEGQNQIIIDSCWAFHNGYNIWNDNSFAGDGNGFKLGGNYISAPHIIRNSIAFDNKSKGFDQNHNTAGITVYNCTSWRNEINYSFNETPTDSVDSVHIFKNNISFRASDRISNSSIEEKNSWNGFTIFDNDFKSIDTSLATLARDENYNLQDTEFLKLSSTSSLIDAGINVGLFYLGVAPDLGAFEFTIPTSVNEIMVNTININLEQNFPNPFNLSTQINYSVNKSSDIELLIYNVLGQLVNVMVKEKKEIGNYSTYWDGLNEKGKVVNSGTYFLVLVTNEYQISRKILLLK